MLKLLPVIALSFVLPAEAGYLYTLTTDGFSLGKADPIERAIKPRSESTGQFHWIADKKDDNLFKRVKAPAGPSVVAGSLYLTDRPLVALTSLPLGANNFGGVDDGTPIRATLSDLSNLYAVAGNLFIETKPIVLDLSSLSSLEHLGGVIRIDTAVGSAFGFKPIPQTAWLCQPAQVDKFPPAFVSQATACGRE